MMMMGPMTRLTLMKAKAARRREQEAQGYPPITSSKKSGQEVTPYTRSALKTKEVEGYTYTQDSWESLIPPYVCLECGAHVSEDYMDNHARWHEIIDGLVAVKGR